MNHKTVTMYFNRKDFNVWCNRLTRSLRKHGVKNAPLLGAGRRYTLDDTSIITIYPHEMLLYDSCGGKYPHIYILIKE